MSSGKLMQMNQSTGNDVDDDSYLSSFPPGYRFIPTDAELVVHYLTKKIRNQPLQPNPIVDIELYKFHPEELISKNKIQGGGQWYFFTPRDRKYPNGSRPSRSASTGYWKATGKDKVVVTDDNIRVGYKKSLVFYEGKPPRGNKTKWMMHEYRLEIPPKRQRAGSHDMRLDDWVLCKIYHKENKKRHVEESDDEHVEGSNDVRKKSREREDINSEGPEIMIRQNIDNYGDADGGLPVLGGALYAPIDESVPASTPFEQTSVSDQNIDNYGASSGELSAPYRKVHMDGQSIGPGGEVHMHSQNINNYGYASGELPSSVPCEVYMHGQNNHGVELPAQLNENGQNIDDYGASGGELPAPTPCERGQNIGHVGEMPPFEHVHQHGQNIDNNGDVGGELPAPCEHMHGQKNGDAGGVMPVPFEHAKVQYQDLGKTVNYFGEDEDDREWFPLSDLILSPVPRLKI